MHEGIQKLYTLAELVELTGRSPSTIWANIKTGDFPAPIRLGPRAVRWPETVVAAWQASLGIGEGSVNRPRGEHGQFVKRALTNQTIAPPPLVKRALTNQTIAPPPPEEPVQTETPVISKPKGKRGRPPKVRGSVESAAV